MPENGETPENGGEEQGKTFTEETPVRAEHTLEIDGDKIGYTSTAGRLPLKDDHGEILAQMYFTAYTRSDISDPADRPLTFVFNGGPGSSSVWLHMGTCGPQRVAMHDEGWLPAPPYKLVDNDYSWLGFTDLVFVDPVGTGFSRAKDEEQAKKYWNVQGDVESVGSFIRLYLTRYERWSSPLFLAGESYGTTRAAALSDHLAGRGIGLNGVVLISNALNFQTLNFGRGNDLPYMVYLPTYAATAWYHGALSDDMQQRTLAEIVAEAEQFAETEYAVALAKGDRLTPEERAATIERLSELTGLSALYLDGCNLRPHIMRFCKELLRERKQTVGRLDSRFTGTDAQNVTEFPEFDPSLVAITPPYTAMFNDYARRVLGYESDLEYQILSFAVNQSWEYERGQIVDTSDALRRAMSKNPHMNVFVGQGYYDLATPHFAAEWVFNHLDLRPEQHAKFTYATYEAGHMFYLHVESLAQFKADVAAFYTSSLPNT